jgi:hypothetical protein
MFKVWRYFARYRGYKWYYGVAVNPISMHMEKKYASVVKDKIIDLPTFEASDGSRPFKDFNYGSYETIIMGYLATLDDAKL